MGATFKDIKKNIAAKVMEKETPGEVVKTCFDAICLMRMLYEIDVEEMAEKWGKGEEVK